MDKYEHLRCEVNAKLIRYSSKIKLGMDIVGYTQN